MLDDESKDIYTVAEVCELLRITTPTLYKLLNDDDGIKSIKAGRRRLIPRIAIQDWIDRQLKGTDDE